LPPGIAQQLQQVTGFPGNTLVLNNFGQATVTGSNGSLNLQVGFATLVGLDGSLSAPFRVPDALLALITRLINQTGNGGVSNPPTTGDVPTDFKFTVVTDPTAPPGTDPLGYISIFGAGNAAGKGVSQTNQAGSVSPPSPSPSPAPPPPPPPPPPPYGN
jgi:hypothetical protein